MVAAYSIFRKLQRSLHSSNFSQSLYSELSQTFISRLFFSTFIPSWRSDHGLSVPRLSTLLGQLLPLHLRLELQLIIVSELKQSVIPARKEQTDRFSGSGLACVAGSFAFRVGKWAGEATKRMRRVLLLPLVCTRFARGFTAHLRERRDHQLHVNLYQFYYFIWLLPVTKKQPLFRAFP